MTIVQQNTGEAIESARAGGFVQWRALANERASEFWRSEPEVWRFVLEVSLVTTIAFWFAAGAGSSCPRPSSRCWRRSSSTRARC